MRVRYNYYNNDFLTLLLTITVFLDPALKQWLYSALSFHKRVSSVLNYARRTGDNSRIFQKKKPEQSEQSMCIPSKHWLLLAFAHCKRKRQTCKNILEILLGIWAEDRKYEKPCVKTCLWSETSGQQSLTPILFIKQTSLRKPGHLLPKWLKFQHWEFDFLLIQFPSWRDAGHRESPNSGVMDPQSSLFYLRCRCIYTKVWAALNHS